MAYGKMMLQTVGTMGYTIFGQSYMRSLVKDCETVIILFLASRLVYCDQLLMIFYLIAYHSTMALNASKALKY